MRIEFYKSRNFDRNFCGRRAATYVAKKCCYMMATNSNIYVSEINFLIFFKIGRNFGFFQKTSSVHVNLSRLKRVPDGQKLIWWYLGVNVAKKQQCCFCCYFSNIFTEISKTRPMHIKIGRNFGGEAEISTEISGGGAQQHMLLKSVDIWWQQIATYM